MIESITNESATQAHLNSLPPSPVLLAEISPDMSTDEIVIEGITESAMGPAVPVFFDDTSNDMATDETVANEQAGRRVKINKYSISELKERLRRNPVTSCFE